jgi:hypothetical protein
MVFSYFAVSDNYKIKSMKKFLLTLLILITFSTISLAQHEETDWTVPELFEFHTVIADMWHVAYPAKDFDKLKSYVPDIKSNMEKINAAKLPGINQDKQEKWQSGLKLFNKTAEAYYNAAAQNDNEALMVAAENLHSNFEMMVRVIKPVMKELDDYHKILYVIYHKYLPEKDFKSVANVMDDLLSKAKAIPEGKIPVRIENKKNEFLNSANELIKRTEDLKSLFNGISDTSSDLIISSIEKMHTQYQNLESVFD